MAVLIRTVIDESEFPSKRAWRAAMLAAHQAMGAHWHSAILPKHFTQAAQIRYRHQRRQQKYLAYKKALAKRGKVKYYGNVDLVFSGQLEKSLSSFVTVRAFPTRVTVSMNGPRYITMRPYLTAQPDKAREITTVVPEESDALAAVADRVVTEIMNDIKAAGPRRRDARGRYI